MGRPAGSKGVKNDSLEQFARRVEAQVKLANLKESENMERLICRILIQSGKNLPLAATMAARWVEWKYGKAKQPISGDKDNPIAVQIITNLDLPPIK